MNPKYIKVPNLLAAIIVLSGFVFSAFLGIAAFISSRETGAGVAQGDLGFFMVLSAATPVILILVGLSFVLMLRRQNKGSKNLRLLPALCGLALLALVWDWFFLLAVWKA